MTAKKTATKPKKEEAAIIIQKHWKRKKVQELLKRWKDLGSIRNFQEWNPIFQFLTTTPLNAVPDMEMNQIADEADFLTPREAHIQVTFNPFGTVVPAKTWEINEKTWKIKVPRDERIGDDRTRIRERIKDIIMQNTL